MILSRFYLLTSENMSHTLFNQITSKFTHLREYLKHLHEIQKVNRKSFVNDYHFYGLAERYFQLAIEVVLDVSKMLIRANRFPPPETNKEVLSILYEYKILPRALFYRLDGVIGFRNVLVHDYEKINRNKVYDKLQKNLQDFVDFKNAIMKYLNRQK